MLRQISLPIPRAPPVTTAHFPSSNLFIIALLAKSNHGANCQLI
jgi:hypothetical protein